MKKTLFKNEVIANNQHFMFQRLQKLNFVDSHNLFLQNGRCWLYNNILQILSL